MHDAINVGQFIGHLPARYHHGIAHRVSKRVQCHQDNHRDSRLRYHSRDFNKVAGSDNVLGPVLVLRNDIDRCS